ncbi:MAG: DUF922 domain-containing protein [Bacteroidota bacterium]
MRLPILIAVLAALSLGSYWVLTGPAASAVTRDSANEPPAVTEEQREPKVVTAPGVDPVAGRRQPVPGRAPRRNVELAFTAASYAVSGTDEQSILRDMVANGPTADDGRNFFGVTETGFDLLYRSTESNGTCALTDVTVMLEVTITLPEWIPSGPVTPELESDWRQFRQALSDHEDTHREIAEETAVNLHRRLSDLRRPTCDEVTIEAQRRLAETEVEIELAQTQYDADTGHGLTEGAVWPLP